MTTTFETAKVGDKVWDFYQGWGVVREIGRSARYPIYVNLASGGYKRYTSGGLYDEDDISQSLFWDEVVIEAPVKPMPDLEVDTKVLVWVHPDNIHKRHFSHFENGDMYTFDDGGTSFTRPLAASVTGWPCWLLAE